MHDGILMGLSSLPQLSTRQYRSISAENPTGAKGGGGRATKGTGFACSRDLGPGWKMSPSIELETGKTLVLAAIEGPAIIHHLWITTVTEAWRDLILRMVWDNEPTPSVEVPLGDFFANGWCERCNVNSQPIVVNPAGGFNSYWPMPFSNFATITLENRFGKTVPAYYQIDYSLGPLPLDTGRLHAQWRRSNPLPAREPHTIVEGVQGHGHLVGLYLAWQTNSNNWWGEGEVKMYLDDDKEFPTYCGTGTEDYFGGAWNWEQPSGHYGTYSTPYLGMHQVITPDGLYRANQRFGMYRWHILDPVIFHKDFRMTIQALGWRSKSRFLALQDDIASTVLWYQTEPHNPFPSLPDSDALEVI
jgi:hypothetical protein